jgi:tetratricopeptide (TPR) repeat protein
MLVGGGLERAHAQAGDALQRAYDAERRGSVQGAIDAYREYLAKRPNELSALLGLERGLTSQGKLKEMVPAIRAAVETPPVNAATYSISVRVYAAADAPDSVRAMAERWARAEPDADTPYREWGAALNSRRDRPGAKAAFLLGRQRLGKPDALAAELAQLLSLEGDYPGAVREWLLALNRVPSYRGSALTTVGTAPEAQRPSVLKLLDQADTPGRRLGAELRVRWGDPVGGFKALAAILPAERVGALDMLRNFLEQVRGQTGPEARRAQGMALEAEAQRAAPVSAPRLMLEAAQAYADGGDRGGARRVLTTLANDGNVSPEVSTGAAMTLIGVLIDDGKVEEAQAQLAQFRRDASEDDYNALVRRIALGWARAGKFTQADSILKADSTVEGMALGGRVKLYQGDVSGALQLLQAAGPYAGTREDAAARTLLFALLQPIEQDSLPVLGKAILALDRGDTTHAIEGTEQLAKELPLEKGGAEMHLFAGRLQQARGHTAEAEAHYRAADSEKVPASAPAAELELARLLVATQRPTDAMPVLEHMILTYPESALVPLARRLMDEVRGGVPST